MSNVVQFKQPERPTAMGRALCINCRHEWDQIGDVGEWQFDCPSCGAAKGIYKNVFGAREGDRVFVCDCGSEALTAYFGRGSFWLRCMNCGVDHTEAVFGS